jgi:uncharacterized protein YggE
MRFALTQLFQRLVQQTPQPLLPQANQQQLFAQHCSRASQSFDVLVRIASKAGTIIEAVVTAGGDAVQLGGVMPSTLNPATATEEARAAAVANAKSKASSYAKLLGTSIGKVLSLEEQSSPVYSSPFPMAKAEAVDSAVQIDLGEQDVTVTITVRWALN